MDRPAPTKLVVAIVQIEDADDLVRKLVDSGFGATRIDSGGGFLKKQNAMVIVATVEQRVTSVFSLVRQTCRRRHMTWFPPATSGMMTLPAAPIEVEVGGAVIFVVPIERVEFLSNAADPVVSHTRAGENDEIAAIHP